MIDHPCGMLWGMGAAPPPDAPTPAEQAAVSADASFEPSPGGASLCGFALPSFTFSLAFNFKFPPFDFPPTFNFAIGLNCDLSNPIDASFSFGGGRVATSDPDPFEEDL